MSSTNKVKSNPQSELFVSWLNKLSCTYISFSFQVQIRRVRDYDIELFLYPIEIVNKWGESEIYMIFYFHSQTDLENHFFDVLFDIIYRWFQLGREGIHQESRVTHSFKIVTFKYETREICSYIWTTLLVEILNEWPIFGTRFNLLCWWFKFNKKRTRKK